MPDSPEVGNEAKNYFQLIIHFHINNNLMGMWSIVMQKSTGKDFILPFSKNNTKLFVR